MALVKCPECGRENVSSTAKSCPGCGYNIKEYFEKQQDKATSANTAAKAGKFNAKAIICIAVVCIIGFCIYYSSTRCAYDGCTEKRTSSGKYCAYHSLAHSYGSSSYNYTPKTGNAGAEAKAESYLNSSAFSYSGLKDQLLYEGFTEDEAQYGVDNCNGDWDEQAIKKAKSYLRSSPDMSRSRLIEQLQYEGFTYEQAVYGVEQNGL